MKATYNPFVSGNLPRFSRSYGKSASDIPFILCLAVFAILPSPLAMAADRTWTGGAPEDSNWGTAANWGGTAPVGNDALIFAGTTRLTNNNTIAADTTFTGITFADAAGAFTLDGNAITLNGGITNISTSDQTINLGFALTGTQLFTNTVGKGDIVVNGIISGNGGLTKAGEGTLTLGAANTYSGTTTVSGGTLVVGVNNLGSLGDTAVAVKSGATLKGSGVIGVVGGASDASVTIESGGVLAPGNSPGLLTIDGDLTLSSGSIFEWELAANKDTDNGTPGTDYDAVNVSGDLNISWDADFRVIMSGAVAFNDLFWNTNQKWSNIFNVSTGSAWDKQVWVYTKPTDSSYTPVDTGVQGYFTVSGTDLNWTALPEPSTALAGLLLGAGLLRRRRN